MWPPQFLECERRGGCYCQWGLTIQQNKQLLMQKPSAVLAALPQPHCPTTSPGCWAPPLLGTFLLSRQGGAQRKLLPRLQEFTSLFKTWNSFTQPFSPLPCRTRSR